MILLAYTIFTMTLVLQRKQAAFGLAVGLASLTVPLVLLLAVSPVHPAAPGLHCRVRAAPVPRPAPTRGPDLPLGGLSTARSARRTREPVQPGTLCARGPRRRRVRHRPGDPIDRTEASRLSKESRRRQRMAGQQSATASAGDGRSSSGTQVGRDVDHVTRRPAQTGTARAGRRERARPAPRRSFLRALPRVADRRGAVVAIVAVVGCRGVRRGHPASLCLLDHLAAGAHGDRRRPMPRRSPATSSPTWGTPRGGRHGHPLHVLPAGVGTPLLRRRPSGPSRRGLTARTTTVIPEGWVHNLEHGGLVVLYRRAPNADQAALRAVYDAIPVSPVCGFPPGGNSPSPVIARFDEMAWPFAALVWDRVLPMQTLDQAAMLDFYARYGERITRRSCASRRRARPIRPGRVGSTEPSAAASASAPRGDSPAVRRAPAASAEPS